MDQSESIQVQVVYARSDGVFLENCTLAQGATIDDAIQASGVTNRHPEIDWEIHQAGVFGKVLQRTHKLVDGDRVEIYRPLGEKTR